MSSNLVLSVKEASVRFGTTQVFENLSFNIHQGSRIALVGKNGAGKTTLMRVITGDQDLDTGDRWEDLGTTIGYLKQDVVVKKGQSVFDYIIQDIPKKDREIHAYKVDIVAGALELDINAKMDILSGGQVRRAGLARALVEEPDILLLDEPTNHLDIAIIEWLEGYLKNYSGTILCVSHDRTFLKNVTNQVFWLDRGAIRVSPEGFAKFDEWSTALLEQEERELKKRKQIVGLEMEWANRGVKARVKRNIRRLETVRAMRDKLKRDESAYRHATKKIELGPLISNAGVASKHIAEFYNVHKSFHDGDKEIKILDGFSYRIARGDRIGILGHNGSGKTTFLKLLIGELEADKGNVKTRKEFDYSYFDQKRSDLNPKETLKRTLCPSGGDHISVMGKDRHVYGYLKSFMFDPSRVEDIVEHLSGGQKNRLMLAKVLADPKQCLILDEPTNDLDMDTLDMLEEILVGYKGTLIVVSHDRDFLDQTVTKILAFEGNTKVTDCIGGYSDYIAQKKKLSALKKPRPAIEPHKKKQTAKPLETAPLKQDIKPKKLTYKLEREYTMIPDQIKELENEVTALKTLLSDADFYKRDADAFHQTTQDLSKAENKIGRLENRWLELEDMKTAL